MGDGSERERRETRYFLQLRCPDKHLKTLFNEAKREGEGRRKSRLM
jgi:hypothetical protein